jgi:polar amino acid transport system substrate-binding protein
MPRAFLHPGEIHTRNPGGFVHYSYLDPADNTVEPKLSYVMMAGKDWVIGSGIYWPDEEDPFVRVGGDPAVRERLKSFVGEAVAYARKHGKTAAINEFNDQKGTFVRGNLYIYAFDYEGNTLIPPASTSGTNLSDPEDAFGVRYTGSRSPVPGREGVSSSITTPTRSMLWPSNQR